VYATIPFTTVNMTEVAFWSASAPNIIHTPANASVGGVGYNPTRGYAYPSSSTANGTVYDLAFTNQLNSGLTGITTNTATTATDASLNLTDKKQFVFNGSGSSGGNSVYFDVVLSGLSWLSTSNLSLDPSVAWSATATQLGTGKAVATTNTVSFLDTGNIVTYAGNSVTTQTCNSNGKNCTNVTTNYPNKADWGSPITAVPVGINVTVQGFNYCAGKKLNSAGIQVDCPLAATGAGSETITCSGTGGSPTFTTATQCYNYQVDYANIKIGTANAAVPAGNVTLLTGTTDGGQSEGAAITIPNAPGISSTTNTTAGANLITIPFTLQSGSPTIAPGTCSCAKTGGCNKSQATYLPGKCAN